MAGALGTRNASQYGRILIDHRVPEVYIEATSVASGMDEICVPLSQPYLLVVSVAPCLVAIENLAFLFAVLLYRTKLKHNNVYTYVTSALMANALTCLWAFYHFLNYYYGFESTTPSFWWAFRKGMTAGFSLILCGNIGLLIYAIEDNTYMLGRLVSGAITNIKSNNRMNRRFRWRKALLLITIAWILPVCYGLLSMTPWNCTSECTCTLYLANGEPLCKGEKCSRLYTPMAKSYLLCIVVIWALECAFLLFVICKAAISLPKYGTPSNRADSSFPSVDVENNIPERNVGKFRRFSSGLARSYRFPFILLGLFMLCTAPVMVLFVLDFAMKDFHANAITVNVITPLPLLYCVISPILLTKRLSGMRSAVSMALSFTWIKGGWNNLSLKKTRRKTNAVNRESAISVSRDSDGKAMDNMEGDVQPTPV